MIIRWRRDLIAWSFVGMTALAVTGCHKDAVPGPSSSASPSASSSPSTSPSGSTITTQVSFSLNTNGGTQTLSASGLSGSLAYSSYTGGTGGSGVTGQYTLTTVEPTLTTLPTGTPIVFGELELGSATVFSGYFGFSSITLPTSLLTLSSSNIVTETVYDSQSGTEIGSPVNGTINGQSVTFAAPGLGSLSANAFDTYYLVISYQ